MLTEKKIDERDRLKLTPWGKFANRYSVVVSIQEWQQIRTKIEHILDGEGDWKFYVGELVAGLKALTDDEGQDSFLAILNREEESHAG